MALQTDYKMLKSPKNRCRICLEATNGKIELNQTIHYKETGILLTELLEFCVNEQVYDNGKADGLCLDCMEKGMVCYEFKRRYKASQAVLLKEMEENNGFSFEIKVEEDFEEGSFVVESDNIVMKHEILEEEEMEQFKENPNECELPTTATEKLTATTTLSDKPTPTLSGDKPTSAPPHQPTISMEEKEENDGFSYAIKAEEDFQEGSFEVESKNIVIKNESLQEEKLEQVKENPNKYELPTTTTETEKSTTTRSDKLPSTLSGDKQTLTPPDDQPTISLGQKEGVEHKCELCEKTFKLRSGLVRHKRKHTQTGKQRNRCSYVQESSAALVQNMRNVFQQETLKYTDPLLPVTETDKPTPPPTNKIDKRTCEYCGKSLSQAGNLVAHMRIHTGEKPFSCKECGMNFSLAGTLASHRRIHTGEKPYSCKECGRSFAHPWALKVHQAVHTEQTDHVCQKCGATFDRELYLRRHVVIHSTERPSYKCTICKKDFRSNAGKRQHMLTHTGVQNYACEFCGKRFNRSCSLTVHRKIHTGERPHICKVCGKGFIQSHHLKKHMNSHLSK